jgi:hypothetical protein
MVCRISCSPQPGGQMEFQTFHVIVVHAEFGFVRHSTRDSVSPGDFSVLPDPEVRP